MSTHADVGGQVEGITIFFANNITLFYLSKRQMLMFDEIKNENLRICSESGD